MKIPAGLKTHIEQRNKRHPNDHQRQEYDNDGEGGEGWFGFRWTHHSYSIPFFYQKKNIPG